MARPRTFNIAESDERLEELELNAATPDIALRFSALRRIKSCPELTIDQVAADLSCGLRSLKRWLALYQREGITALLRPAPNMSRISPDIAKQIQRLFPEEEGYCVDAIRRWLTEQYGIRVSGTTIRRMQKRFSSHALARTPAIQETKEPISARASSEWLASFVVSLPPLISCTDWAERFRTSLANYLGGVDRITVGVNVRSLQNSVDPSQLTELTDLVIRHVPTSVRSRSRILISDVRGSGKFSDQRLQQMREGGFPFEQYHPPYAREYLLNGTIYLGMIILWNSVDRPPLRSSTIERLEALDSEVRFLMTDCAARHQCTQPATQNFYPILNELVETAKLTKKEKHVIYLQLLGSSYKDIADTLGISVQTVGRHVSNIHYKTGTQGHTELFAKYFAPRLE